MLSMFVTWPRARRAQAAAIILTAAMIFAVVAVGPVMAEANSCQELLVNGNMETADGWSVQTNGDYNLFSNYQARSGQSAAYLAGVNGAEDALSQTLSLPANHQTTLRFWWLINSEENSNGWDGFSVQLADANGAPLRVLFAASDRSAGYSWQQTTIDLTEFAGQTVQLRLQGRTDATLSTDFFVDDMSMTACDLSASGTFFLPFVSR
ncbi:MAG: hypothetical protein R2873_30240 [Caldilineaceae bacterium]|nr:hypothetical protein [Caldilineaceae bacterium]